MSAPGPQPIPPPQARFLVRGPHGLRNAVLSTPALLRLRAAFPAAHIALLTPESCADLWQYHPAVDTIHAFHREEGPLAIGRQIRLEGFDVGIAFAPSFRAALELWIARIPMRIGHAGGLPHFLLTHRVARPPGWTRIRPRSNAEIRRRTIASSGTVGGGSPFPRVHAMQECLELVAPLGADSRPVRPQLFLAEAERSQVRDRFALHPDRQPSTPLVALHASTGRDGSPAWPPDRFIETVVQTHRRIPCRWIILGGVQDRSLSRWLAVKLAQAIAPKSPDAGGTLESVIHVAGKTSLRELCAVLQCCRVLLSNDSAPMHLAAAVGTRVLGFFGGTHPALTAPGLPDDPRHRLLVGQAPCAPCHRRDCPIDLRCLKSIRPEDAVEALMALLRPDP